jgi:hypothetical protein
MFKFNIWPCSCTAAGVAAQPTSSSTVILETKVFNIGIVPAGEEAQYISVIGLEDNTPIVRDLRKAGQLIENKKLKYQKLSISN